MFWEKSYIVSFQYPGWQGKRCEQGFGVAHLQVSLNPAQGIEQARRENVQG